MEGCLSLVGLVGIALVPQYTYFLLWFSPLMVFVLVQILFRERCVLDELKRGNWGLVFRYGIAAFCCGFCWELWNYFSYVKWVYNVPYVHGLQVFEMPLVGFAGYIPFGVECATILHWMGVINDGINGDTPSRKLVKQGFRAVFPSSGASGAESEP